uniref:Uncharacterized protein n=1 Tax=viral metagenome TaxID=1070528 RepID=A0A6C0D692_9ZZZZ
MEKSSTTDDKHKKYYSSYIPNDLFWGIGIENETYLEVSSIPEVSGLFFKNQKRERYSLNYYETYLNEYFNKALDTLINKDNFYSLPYLINCHELTKNDLSGNPKTNYDKASTPNKRFSGKTVFEHMCEQNLYFKDEYEKSYCFDGDTVEFMTQNYYKKTIQDVISELKYHKKQFLNNINKLGLPLAQGKKLEYPKVNHGFARFSTNKNNLAIFNNGTYHFNFTLPTLLDDCGNIADKRVFEKKHSKAIKVIQLLEPFFIAKYGSNDTLSRSSVYSNRFPKGSQRIAASRYVSAGTYDSNKMKSGKILQEDRYMYEPLWYSKLYKQIHYVKNNKIGFDINYNKFKNHGIELRFFDWFPEEHLEEVLTFLVYLLDHSYILSNIENPIKDEIYNDIMYNCILKGKDTVLSTEHIAYIKTTLKLKVKLKDRNIISVYDSIFNYFKKLYEKNGECSKYMLDKPITKCCSTKCCSTKYFSIFL